MEPDTNHPEYTDEDFYPEQPFAGGVDGDERLRVKSAYDTYLIYTPDREYPFVTDDVTIDDAPIEFDGEMSLEHASYIISTDPDTGITTLRLQLWGETDSGE